MQSGFPSPLKSAIAKATGKFAEGKFEYGEKLTCEYILKEKTNKTLNKIILVKPRVDGLYIVEFFCCENKIAIYFTTFN